MTQTDPHLEALLLHLKESRGFDFTGYKRASLTRRVRRRMTQVGVGGFAEYRDYLQVHSDEFTLLFNAIFINVTRFFRDPQAWSYLREEVLPRLLAASEAGEPIRLWSAGCASGEEAYTLAMVVAEALGPEQFRRRVKIYATDVDDEALSRARLGSYTARQLTGVPAELVERYFDPAGDGWFVFRKPLRRCVIFGRNDLVQDAPISRVELLVCRNTLMYFNSEMQSRILTRFHFALNEGGVLFLGKAEMLLNHSRLFAPVDPQQRIFRKATATTTGNATAPAQAAPPPVREDLLGLDRLRDEAILACPVAQVVVTATGLVALANRHAETILGVSSRDLGRPFQDLEVSSRPVELRDYIDQARLQRRTIRVPDVELVSSSGARQWLEVQVKPLINSDASLLGVALVFQDTTALRRLRSELEHANRQAETAYEELQSTNEELETTNEELQSSVEELETTNEELQSTNEELETTNEELQSTNDELTNINNELRERTTELDNATALLEAVLTGLRAGVTVLDADMRIRAWNRRAEQLWGLREQQVLGVHLLNLDIGLPIGQLRPLLRQALAGEPAHGPVTVTVVNRRGRTVAVRVVCTPLVNHRDGTTGAILLMETDDPAPA